MMDDYHDIIDLPHPDPQNHPRMSMLSRAALFAPFAALTGYDAAIQETARLTDEQMFLDDYLQELLNRKYQLLQEHLSEQPTVTIVYFEPDTKKSGGSYRSATGIVKCIDEYNRCLVFTNGQQILLKSIIDIEGIEE